MNLVQVLAQEFFIPYDFNDPSSIGSPRRSSLRHNHGIEQQGRCGIVARGFQPSVEHSCVWVTSDAQQQRSCMSNDEDIIIGSQGWARSI
jgi:hypothetical protein